MNSCQSPICGNILQAIADTFEMMIFMQITPTFAPTGSLGHIRGIPSVTPASQTNTGEMPNIPLAEYYGVGISVTEPIHGRMYLFFPCALAVEVTKNLYGWLDDAGIADAVLQDAISELINTICGRILSSLVAENQSFALGLPEKADLSISIPEPMETCWFFANGIAFPFIISGELISWISK